ncbi:hypothetical protein I4U23_011661 [Adineta vaga]|nr:hypothetical protein I4U23_011661 [Adineta vaga]
MMMISNFECLPVDVVFEIFGYLSPVNILQSFYSLNKRLSTILIYEYLWHIHIDDNTMSLTIFKDFCQNVIKLIGRRVLSLHIRLNNIIGGWSLVLSSLKYQQTTLLRHLHLIDIKQHEFEKLLCDRLIRQLHTLLVDLIDSSSFKQQIVEGAYLAKVCSQLPNLRSCRLPFNFCLFTRDQLLKVLTPPPPLMTLPNVVNTIYLHTLTIGLNSIDFLERLVKCIPSIENLSVGIQDAIIFDKDEYDFIPLPVAVDSSLLPRLSRLRMNCVDKRSFHRTVALFSSVFIQLTHLSLKLFASISISDSLIISGDTIQQLCIDRLRTSAIYTLKLTFRVRNDSEKIILHTFFNAPFTRRQRPKVFIHEYDRWMTTDKCYYVAVYTLPYNGTILPTYLFSKDLAKSCQMSMNAFELFSHANELVISDYGNKVCLSNIRNCKSSISLLIPWSLLTIISITNCDVITADELEPILRMAYNVHTLRIYKNRRISSSAIMRIYDNLESRASEQIESIEMHDRMLTLNKAKPICMLLCNRFSNLKQFSFTIYQSLDIRSANSSYIIVYKNESTKSIINLIHFLVDHLQQLVSLRMEFVCCTSSETPCFPNLIRRQLHEWPLNRPYRLRCSTEEIQICL